MLVTHTLADGRVVKLGKRPAAHDDWEKKIRHWPMMKMTW
jgi:hypothetical protein